MLLINYLGVLPGLIVSFASVLPITIQELVAQSDLIAVVTVTETKTSANDGGQVAVAPFPPLKIATARVIETWKGPKTRFIRFIASPNEHCDTSRAEKGDNLVLFLEQRGNSPILRIAHLGRGKMVIEVHNGVRFATLAQEIRLPEHVTHVERIEYVSFNFRVAGAKKGEIRTVSITDPVIVRSMELKALRKLVSHYVSKEQLRYLMALPIL